MRKKIFQLIRDITVLTETTFDKAIEKYNNLLVVFYSPECGKWLKFQPDLENSAQFLRSKGIIVAKVNVIVEKNLAEKYKVQSYPALKLFKKDIIFDYYGRNTKKDVVTWVTRKAKPITIPLTTVDEVENFKINNDICVVYFGNDEKDLKIIQTMSIKFERLFFGVVENENIAKNFNAKQRSVVLFKQFDEKRNDIDKIEEKELYFFIDKHSKRKIESFEKDIVERVFKKHQPAIVYFGDYGDKWKEHEKIMRKISEKKNDRLLIIMTEIDEGAGKRIAEHVGIKSEKLPVIMILDSRRELKKYVLEGNIDEKNILNFIDGWEKGKLKKFFKTQEEPKENNGDVLIVVAKTLEKEIISNNKDVMLLLHTPWCKNCNKILPNYEEIAKKLKAKNPNLILAKMDYSQNDVDFINVSELPTIIFFPGNKKNKPPLLYNGKKTTEDIIQFIKENAYNIIVLSEEKKDEKIADL